MGKSVTGNSGEKKNNSGIKNLKPYKKGTSGNPSGRPKKTQEMIDSEKEAEDALIMLQNALPEAAQKVIDLIREPTTAPAVKVRILELMLDRSYGKAFQSVQIDTGANDVSVSIEEPAEDLAK